MNHSEETLTRQKHSNNIGLHITETHLRNFNNTKNSTHIIGLHITVSQWRNIKNTENTWYWATCNWNIFTKH